MTRRSLATLAGIVASTCLATAGLADEDCTKPETALDLLGYDPWPNKEVPLGVGIGGEVSYHTLSFPRPHEDKLTEHFLLHYFVENRDDLPSIDSSLRYGTSEIGLDVVVSRTWRFRGLSFTGDAVWGAVRPRAIHLSTAAHPLRCALAIGAPLTEFERVLGPPAFRRRLDAPEPPPATGYQLKPGSLLYLFGSETGSTLTLTVNAAGVVTDIRWHFGYH